MCQHLGCGRPPCRVQSQEGGKQLVASSGEEGEFGADDGADGLLGAGETKGAGVGEALEARPSVFGGDAA